MNMPSKLRVLGLALSLVAGACGGQAATPNAEVSASQQAPAPAPVQEPAAPVGLRGEGFEIPTLPEGITARATSDAGDWELVDASQRRVAVIREAPHSHVDSLALGTRPTRVAGLDAERTEGPPTEPWDAQTPTVVRWRFESTSYIYDVQHRPGAEWVVERWQRRDPRRGSP